MGGGDSGTPPIGPPPGGGGGAGGGGGGSAGGGGSTGDDTEPADEEDPEEEPTPQETTPSDDDSKGPGATGAPVPTPEEPPAEEADEPDDEEADAEEEPDTPPEAPEPVPEPPDEETDAEEDDDDDDDEEDQVAQVVVHSDPWDNVGFGLYPIRYQLKEEYGDQIQIDDRLVPVREFESPGEMAAQWEQDARRHEMPVDPSVWSANPPESTALSNRAFAAAREQSIARAKDYIRRLRVAAIVEGRNIEDRETLLDLAGEVGLDTDQLAADWDDVNVRTSTRDVDTPKTTIHVDGTTVTQQGYLHVDDLKMMFDQAGLEAEDPQPLPGFVDEYGPVALKEVRQVYGWDEATARNELRAADGVEPVTFGDATFWTTFR